MSVALSLFAREVPTFILDVYIVLSLHIWTTEFRVVGGPDVVLHRLVGIDAVRAFGRLAVLTWTR